MVKIRAYKGILYIFQQVQKNIENMLTSYIYGSILKMLQGSRAHNIVFPFVGIEKRLL